MSRHAPVVHMLIDGTWSGQRFTLRGGYHDLSPSFATLSATTARGVRESYLNTSWVVASSATITLDLRDTLDREPDPRPRSSALQSGLPQARARAVTLQGAVSLVYMARRQRECHGVALARRERRRHP